MPIAACLIVRNSKEIVGRAIESIRPFVNEINVFDTGSTDGTPKLLRELNAQKKTWWDPALGQFTPKKPKTPDEKARLQAVPLASIRVKVADPAEIPTIDGSLSDFSWAREQSFAMASPECDWLFWIDDDDVVIGAQHLQQIAQSAHPSTDGFLMFYDYAQDEQGTNVCQLWRERLIRRSEDGAWINPVHEVWLPHGLNGDANYMGLPREMIQIKHLRPGGDRYPSDRNLRILRGLAAEAEAKGEQPDLRTRAYLGTEMLAHGDHEAAIPWLNAYLADPESRPPSDERAQMFHKLALCLIASGNQHAAMEVEFQALRERDDWTENLVGLMEAFYAAGNMERVLVWGNRALELGMPQSPLILNPLELDLLPRLRVSEALSKLGRFDEAKESIQKALTLRPGDANLQQLSQVIDHEATIAKVVGAVLTLRETLIRHDENWKAWELFDAIPYIIQDHPLIVSAKAMTRENVMHALKPEEYLRWYEDEPKESTVEDEQVEVLGDQIERAGFTLELAERFEAEHGRKPRILDLGANDAWMACFLWKKGEFVCDGIELNKASVAKGMARMHRFGAPGRLVQGDIHDAGWLQTYGTGRFKTYAEDEWMAAEPGAYADPNPHVYDIVTCYEVYEHVPDTDRLLSVMESVLTPEGTACITTPAGAFEQGNLQYWHLVERKGHLRAVTPTEVARQLNARGEVEIKVHQNNRLTWAAWKPRKKIGRVHFVAGGAWEPWSPRSIHEGGLGGSETALVQVAGGLAQLGYDVRVFTDAVPGLYAGMVWEPSAAFDPTEEADAIIVSRNPAAFNVELHAPTRALWCHDHSYEISELELGRITDLVTLSRWHRDRTLARHGDKVAEKLRILRNGIFTYGYSEHGGIDLADDRFPGRHKSFLDRKPQLIYSSSADRGLDVLLEMWPQILERTPAAELHVYYGWNVFDAVARFNPALKEYKAKVLGLVESLGGEGGGVFMHGRVGQAELRAAMADARVWGYPTAFLETSCISAMEARRSGLAIVTSQLGALAETVGEGGRLIPWDASEEETYNLDPAYQKQFVENVTLGLTDAAYWQTMHERALYGTDELDWRYPVAEWAAMIEKNRSH